MKRKSFTITLLALLALLLSVGGVTGQGPEPEGGVQPEGDVSAAATVGSLISYQGRLTEGGSPVTGNRDMTFRFYSDSSCSTLVGGSISRPGVTVTGGLFSVKLDVGASDFNGQGLWLGVDVGNTGTNVICEEILPAPYALSLRPGAVIENAGSHVVLNYHIVKGISYQYGVYAESEGMADANYGLYGLASDTSGTAYGVFGRSDSTSGRGVYGLATASTGTAYGVYGRSDSTSGRGVYGVSDSGYGVYGESNSSYGVYALSDSGVGLRAVSDSDTAVWAETSGGFAAVDGHNTTGYGVRASSDSGVGLRATSNSDTAVWAVTSGGFAAVDGHNTTGTGVHGRSDSGYGVYGRSDSASAAGVYARGTGWGPDLILDGDSTTDDGRIYSDPAYSSSDIVLVSNDAIRIDLNNDGDDEDADFEIYDQDDTLIFNVDDSGMTTVGVLQITGGADLAEPFEIAGAESILPGMVVAIDPQHPGQLRVADKAYDRTVAGCVSGAHGINPGLTMQQEGTRTEGSLPVALSGRVYCWADASTGPIQPGDLLTTSDTPGHVMKVTEYELAQGAIIGKAMSSLTEGRGFILVLVSLQ